MGGKGTFGPGIAGDPTAGERARRGLGSRPDFRCAAAAVRLCEADPRQAWDDRVSPVPGHAVRGTWARAALPAAVRAARRQARAAGRGLPRTRDDARPRI